MAEVKTLLTVEDAKSSRSTCKECGEKIEKGSKRVGIEAFIAGRISHVWRHADCFPSSWKFDIAPSGRGKCKYSGDKLEKVSFWGIFQLSCVHIHTLYFCIHWYTSNFYFLYFQVYLLKEIYYSYSKFLGAREIRYKSDE